LDSTVQEWRLTEEVCEKGKLILCLVKASEFRDWLLEKYSALYN
jgi:hypothetical protein